MFCSLPKLPNTDYAEHSIHYVWHCSYSDISAMTKFISRVEGYTIVLLRFEISIPYQNYEWPYAEKYVLMTMMEPPLGNNDLVLPKKKLGMTK